MENNPTKKKGKAGKVILSVFIALILLAVIAVGGAFLWYKHSLTAVCEENCKEQSFVVAEASSGNQIADNLEKSGLIRSALAFKIYLKLEAKNQTLMPGEYDFTGAEDVEKIVKSLNEGVVAKTFRITFLPGGTLTAARERLQKAGYKDEEITAAFNKTYDHPLLAGKPADVSLEGYIYGDTYEFYVGETVENILKKIFDHMYKDIKDNNLEAKYKASGWTLYQGITLASVVQSEAGIMPLQDQKQVSQVFTLRLKRGIVLGSDAIIAYRADQINPNRSKSDMSYLNTIPCPWNSRKCAGLPPTPISNPGKNALIAAAEPAEGDYLYFISGYDADGNLKMFYAHTEAEHNANIRNYCGDLCKSL